VKSIISEPSDGAAIELPTSAPIAIRGAAWAGESAIARVDVSTDGGQAWSAAELGADHSKYSWRLWRYEWKPARPGFYSVLSRATDVAGRVQPMEALWNTAGYMWNAVDKVGVQIRE
jgi:Mo-co oxidoreductase dimerisation domain